MKLIVLVLVVQSKDHINDFVILNRNKCSKKGKGNKESNLHLRVKKAFSLEFILELKYDG